MGRTPLNIDHSKLVSDRLSGMSLTNVAKKYQVSRASVVRFCRLAQQQVTTTNQIQPMQVKAAATKVA